MAVTADAPTLFANHQRSFGMSFQADQAINDVHAHLLERPGPADVRRFVTPGLEFHQSGDLLAPFGGAYQGRDDGAVPRCPVERLLDSQDLGVTGSPFDECLRRQSEALVGVVQENVPVRNRREHVEGFVFQGDQPGRRDR